MLYFQRVLRFAHSFWQGRAGGFSSDDQSYLSACLFLFEIFLIATLAQVNVRFFFWMFKFFKYNMAAVAVYCHAANTCLAGTVFYAICPVFWICRYMKYLFLKNILFSVA